MAAYINLNDAVKKLLTSMEESTPSTRKARKYYHEAHMRAILCILNAESIDVADEVTVNA